MPFHPFDSRQRVFQVGGVVAAVIFRRLAQPEIFLTFDDGPAPASTPAVLEVLRRTQTPATFFLVTERMKASRSLIETMLSEGHSLGNHSRDHGYSAFFASRARLRRWILNAREDFATLGLPRPVGFRPPAGVVTPPLKQVLHDLGEPLILWDQRFYDTVIPFTRARAARAAMRLRSGGVILLHDRQPSARVSNFCQSLEDFILAAKARGLRFACLRRDHFGSSSM